jgi:RNA polymerase sigma factor (TIGR02999 family)
MTDSLPTFPPAKHDEACIDLLSPSDNRQIEAIEIELAPLMAERVAEFYQTLRKLAARELSRSPAATLNTTGLVNELYLKLLRLGTLKTESEQHFLALSVMAMRNILVDRARQRLRQSEYQAQKEIDQDVSDDESVLHLHHALERLRSISPRLEQVVVCRWFGGLTEIETAGALNISERSVRRDWEKARLWLAEVLV